VDGSDNVDDELRPSVGSNRRCVGDRRRCRGSARAQEMSTPENEDEKENERAGGEPPARRREGVQHVVNSDNKGATRGCPDCAESVSFGPASRDATFHARPVYHRQ
jgi:hypothetical protein